MKLSLNLEGKMDFGKLYKGAWGRVADYAHKRASIHQLIVRPQQRTYGVGNPDPSGAYLNVYRECVWIFAGLDARSSFVASIPFKLYWIPKGGALKDKVELDYADPASVLLRKINPFQVRFDHWKATHAYLPLRGDCYWLKEDGGPASEYKGLPEELWVMRPDRVKIKPDPEKFIDGYIYTIGGESIRFPAEKVVHFKTFNPVDDFYGQSAITAAQRSIVSDLQAQNYNLSVLKNDASPRGALISKYETLDDSTMERLDEQWNKAHRGPLNAGKIAVMTGDLKYEKLGFSQSDLEYLKGRKLSCREQLAVIHTPPVLVSLTEDLNYATAKEQIKQFVEIHMMPELIYITEMTNEFLVEDFNKSGMAGRAGSIVGAYDLEGIPALQEDTLSKAKASHIYIVDGTKKINEVRKELWGAEPVAWGDEFWVGANKVPASSLISAQPTKEETKKENARMLETRLKGYTPAQLQRWQRYAVRTSRVESESRKALLEMFAKQEQHTLKMLDERGADVAELYTRSVDDFIDMEFLLKSSRSTIKKILRAACELGIMHGMEPIDFVTIEFTINNPAVLAFIEQESLTAVADIVGTTVGRLQKAMQQGMSEGETLRELKARLSKEFAHRRANVGTIARTEVQRAVQDTQQNLWQESGVVRQKQWISSADAVTRNTHAAVHAETVDIGDTFSNGLRYPGDGAGDASETINCRCDMVPVVTKRSECDTIFDRIDGYLIGDGGKGSRQCQLKERVKSTPLFRG